jgi:hypothetical protein
LRDLLIGLNAHKSKYYLLGFGKDVIRSNLAKANEKRNYKIFNDFAIHLINEARMTAPVKEFDLNINSNVYDLIHQRLTCIRKSIGSRNSAKPQEEPLITTRSTEFLLILVRLLVQAECTCLFLVIILCQIFQRRI